MLKHIRQVLKTMSLTTILLFTGLTLTGCEEKPWNNPYPFDNSSENTMYLSFSERPKHLDPARSYSEPEWRFICQIYEPPLEYHYLKRPYQLQPLTADQMPEIIYLNHEGQRIGEEAPAEEVMLTEYRIRIKPGIFYQSHPAFAKDEQGKYRYLQLTPTEASKYRSLADFKETGTKELIAEDYVYQIKRLAEPNLSSPIFGVMSKHIWGLAELRSKLLEANKETSKVNQRNELDLRNYSFDGAEVLDQYTYRVRIKGKYPQFRFWLAMPFFSPVPWEVAQFFAQPGFERKNISLDWYPVGTGPYQLTENNPDRRMVLVTNPNFRGQLYPDEGMPNDQDAEFLKAAGSKIPSVAKVNFTLEKEDIPFWNKFLQGYYDYSGISSDNFNSAIRFSPHGSPEVSEQLKDQKIRLQTSVSPSLWMWGFNMLDDTLGGNTEKTKLLRQAISLAFDVQEFIDIFMNGRGILAYGPIPPDIFGYEAQQHQEDRLMEDRLTENQLIEDRKQKSIAKQLKIKQAKALLQKAGIEEGFVIYYDAATSGNPDEIAMHSWFTEQFKKIGLRMVMRGSNYNRFQEKLLQGTGQMYFWGWNADYPDPENFLFLFYGPNAAAKHGGENVTNFHDEEYDALFEQMRSLPDQEERLNLIRKMLGILQRDLPAIWGFYPQSFALYHQWMRISKPSGIINNNLKYAYIEPSLRSKDRILWNQPILLPLWIMFILIAFTLFAIYWRYTQKEQTVRGRI